MPENKTTRTPLAIVEFSMDTAVIIMLLNAKRAPNLGALSCGYDLVL